MKKKAITIFIVVFILNLIIPKAFAAMPDTITGDTDRSSFEDILNARDPNSDVGLLEEGEATSYPASTTDKEGEYKVTPETSTVGATPSAGGAIAGALAAIINLLPMGISYALLPSIVDSHNNGTSKNDRFTIQDLVMGRYDLFNIDFFTDQKDNSSEINIAVAENTAAWYAITMRIAIVIALCMLIYVGIRMSLSTLVVDKVKYKKMVTNWAFSFCLIFFMHYIIIFAMNLSNTILNIIPEPEENMETLIIQGDGSEDKPGIEGQTLNRRGWNYATSCVLFWIIVYYQVKFFFLYLKRLMSVSFLIIIAPLITISYSIDKLGDGKAQGFSLWLKEILVNIFVQPLHALLYVIFMVTAAEIAQVAPLFAILFMMALSRGEKIMKNLFNIRNLSSIRSVGKSK